jgi:hypothetical protein
MLSLAPCWDLFIEKNEKTLLLEGTWFDLYRMGFLEQNTHVS